MQTLDDETEPLPEAIQGRPRTLPDWSAYDPNHLDRHAELRRLLLRRR